MFVLSYTVWDNKSRVSNSGCLQPASARVQLLIPLMEKSHNNSGYSVSFISLVQWLLEVTKNVYCVHWISLCKLCRI